VTALARNGLAVIWDMDGTMVDTAELHFAAWQEMGNQLGRTFTRAEFTRTFGWRNPEILRELYGNRFSDREIADLGDQKEELYRAAATSQGVELLPGVGALLEELQARGFRQAVGSSAPRANLELILRLTNVEQFFDAVVSMEDTERGKPDPQVFLVAAKKLDVPPENCLVIEDAPAGVEAARAGDMKCIAVDFAGHHSADQLVAAGADRVVRTLEEVSAAVVEQLLRQEASKMRSSC
jgi:beta-phosphoglucomutase